MQYTFEDFKNTKIAVRISNQSQWVRFLNYCDENGVSFTGGNASAKRWETNWKNMERFLLCRRNRLTWMASWYSPPDDVEACVHVNELLCPAVEETGRILNKFLPNGFPKIEPQTVNCRCTVLTEKPAEHPKYEIIIKCTGDLTYAQMYVNDELVKTEFARRNPADKFNWRIGAQTAFNRLWEKKNQKPDVREVKRLAKPGEWVKIVKKSSEENEDYKIGDVLQIVHRTKGLTGHAYYRDMKTKFLYEYEYVVLEGYKPE